MYIELDHKLVPGKIKDINKTQNLPGRDQGVIPGLFGRKNQLPHKYKIEKGTIKQFLHDIQLKRNTKAH